MSHTIKVVMRLEKLSKKSNEAPVCVRITKNRETTYKTLFRLDPKFWDADKGHVKKSHPNAGEHNATITKTVAEYDKEALLQGLTKKSHGVSGIRDIVHKKQTLDFIKYAIGYVEQLEIEGTYSVYKKYKTVVYKFRNFIGKDSMQINGVTPELIKRYEKYLSESLKNGVDTITVNMKALRKLYRDAVEKYNLDTGADPFKDIKFKLTQPARVFLTEEEIGRFLSLKCKPMSPHANVRHIFLFECYTGLRIGDILTLKWRNYDGNTISLTMQKTGKVAVLPLSDVAKNIVEDRKYLNEKYLGEISPNNYIFDMLKVDVDTASKKDTHNAISSSNAQINKTLKSIAKRLNISKTITTHTGRHSFATLLITKGANVYAIKELLGHSDVKVTQIYAKVVDEVKNSSIDLLNGKYYERGSKIFDNRGGTGNTEGQ